MPDQYLPFNGDTKMCDEVISIKKRFSITTAIELGSCVGGTTKWLGENFDKVITVEINPTFREFCLHRIKGMKNIYSQLGDTVKLLPDILSQIKNDSVYIFVDSHWSDNNPLLRELEIIAESGLKPCIEIHDMYNPVNPHFQWDKYPNEGIEYNWAYIEKHIEAIYGKDGYEYYYNSQSNGAVQVGCVFIVPKV